MKMEIAGLIPMRKPEIPAAVQLFTAVYDLDPGAKHICGIDHYNYRTAALMNYAAVAYAFKHGYAFKTSDQAEGMVLILPPDHFDISTLGFLSLMGFKTLRLVPGGVLKRLMEFSACSKKLHHQSMHCPHWYIFYLGVKKEFQGKGYGGRIMHRVMDYFNQHAQVVYLETLVESNLEFYGHFGFRLIASDRLPGTEIKIWGMRHDPDQGSANAA